MAFHPSAEDYAALERFLELVLDTYKAGRIDRDKGIGVLAHVMAAAAIDDAGEFRAHIRLSESQLFED